jgi:DNA repair protein RecO (recombination protein O)
MPLYRQQGVVLRTYKLGETDRIVNLLTPGRGKVRAVAKGVRKPGSRIGGRLEPFSHVDLQLYEGRNLDIVTQAELITPFDDVRTDFALSACASTMAEAADRVAQEQEGSNRLFLLLLDGLRALSRFPDQPVVLLDAFLLRLVSVAGYHPFLDACAGCGDPGPHLAFVIAAGGTLCPACAPAGTRPLGADVLELLRGFGTADWPELARAGGEPRARRAAGALVNSFLTYHLGKPLKSWDLVPR